MKSTFGFWAVFLFLLIPFTWAHAESIDALWKKVSEAEGKGLPQTAVDSLKEIYKKACAEKKYGDALRAICKQLVFEANIKGNKPEEKVRRLEEEILKADPAMKPLLQAVLAQWYWHYFSSNRYRFMGRTQTAGLSETDFTTWDLPKLFKKISGLYIEILAGEAALKKIKISEFADLFEKGNQPAELRPTLFDFIAYKALEFFTSGEQAAALPQDAFEVRVDSPAFEESSKFMAAAFESTDTASPKLIALKIYQRIMEFHKEDGNLDAFIDCDLARLNYVRAVATGGEKSGTYIKRMKEITAEYSKSVLSSIAYYHWAQEVMNSGDLVAALKIAQEGNKSHPASHGSQLCANIVIQIEAKSVNVEAELSVPPAAKSKLMVKYKNIDTVTFRVVEDDWRDYLDDNGRKHFNWMNEEEVQKLLDRKPVAEWTVPLPETKDYKETRAFVDAPELKPGFYRVFASYKKDFSRSGNAIQHCPLWVTALSVVSRSRDGNIEGLIVESVSGNPIKGATVKLYRLPRNYDHKNRIYEVTDTVQTDENGQFRFADCQNKGSALIYASDGRGSEYLDHNGIYSNNRYPDAAYARTVFFTDRAIYRPGQLINFKGLCIRVNKENNNYDVVPNQKVVVIFRDHNSQEIARQTLTSNEFGSVSGTFTAPSGRATGTMTILTNHPHGSCSFRVEEYKRPKFTVDVKTPMESYRLNDQVTITGEVMAYTGAPIDSATIKYRITREVRMPYWWSYYFWGYAAPPRPAQEIDNGKIKTDVAGKFSITFKAVPDERISKADDPSFIYCVHVDATDSAGETRSDEKRVRIGYTALEARMSAQDWQAADSPVEIKVDTQTLDGNPVQAEGTVEMFELSGPASPVKAELAPEYWYWYFSRRSAGNEDNSDGRNVAETSNWSIWPSGKSVEKKGFSTDGKTSQKLSFKLAPGAYRAVLTTNDRFGEKVKSVFPVMVIDPKAVKFGPKVPDYFVSRTATVEPGEKYQGYWGTGYGEGRAFVEIFRDDKVIKNYWTPAGETGHSIEVAVPEEYRGGFMVCTTFVRENRLYSHSVKVDVPWSNKNFDVSFETFRSKLQPGQEETWTVKVKGPGAERTAAEFVAALYDESLDAFVPHNFPGLAEHFKSDRTYIGSRYSNSRQNLNSWVHSFGGGIYVQPRIYINFPNEIVQNWGGYGFPEEECFDSVGGPMRDAEGGAPMMKSRSAGAIPPPAPSAAPAQKMMKSEASADMALSKEKGSAPGEPADLNVGGGGGPAEPKFDLSKVAARKNLNETAFFYPQLTADAEGAVKISFKMPEALTKWHFLGFAHGKKLEWGRVEEHAVTQKDLMVQPNPPRFMREGDIIEFPVKVTNMTEKDISGKVRLTLLDPVSEKPVDDKFANSAVDQDFSIPAKQSRSFSWKLCVPDGQITLFKFKAVGSSGDHSDGEEGVIPVLSRRIFVQESIPLPIRGEQKKTFKFEKLLASAKSDTLKHFSFTVQMTSNPSWYAIQALPYLMEFPHECSEQVFNRLYANAMAKHIADSDPKIRRVFDLWKGTDALKSNLEKNEQLKSVLLLESPWVLQGKSESEAKQNVGILFDDNRLKAELQSAYDKLKNMQLSDGAWPWFPGGYPNSYITLYIVTGFGRMKNLEINKVQFDLAIRALDHLDRWIDQIYRDILKYGHRDQNNLSSTIALYLYGRSFFLKDSPIPGHAREAVDYFLAQAKEYWLKLDSRMSQGHLAIALNRFKDVETAKAIMASIKERSQSDEELGMFWGETELSWWWYRAPIETQALMIEAFDEILGDRKAVEECKIWLLKQKQTQDWKTTKATSDAIYALICRGDNLLASDALVEVTVGGSKVEPAKVEAGTGFYEKRYEGAEVKPSFGEITVNKTDKGIAWGGAHWQYMEDMTKVTPHTQNPLKLKKSVFVTRQTKAGPVIEPVGGPLEVGDLVKIRIELRTDRDMEYVHMKDGRGSGLEPVNVLSQYKYQDGLRYYESTKDTATHFYIDYLPKGTYVFEYGLRVQHRGKYGNGIAHIECMYAPEFNSHSESVVLEAK